MPLREPRLARTPNPKRDRAGLTAEGDGLSGQQVGRVVPVELDQERAVEAVGANHPAQIDGRISSVSSRYPDPARA